VDGSDVDVVGNYVHELEEFGIRTTTATARVRVADNKVAYINGIGIHVSGLDNIVERNDVSRSFSTGDHDADGMRMFGQGHVFRDNYVHDIYESDSTSSPHSDCFQSFTTSNAPELKNIVLERNVCSTDRHCVIISNVSGPRMENITIRDNVCHSRKGSAGFFVGHDTGQDDSIRGIVIVNNLVDLESGYFAVYSDNAYDLTVINNVLVGDFEPWSGEATSAGRGFVEHHNLTSATPLYFDPSHPDPRTRYRPAGDSPVVDQGSNAEASSTDLDGNPRVLDGDADGSAVVDIGPYEYTP
jgi:hypothetical protein